MFTFSLDFLRDLFYYRSMEEVNVASFGHGGNAKIISREKNIDFKEIIDFSTSSK